ncbi:MAG: DUF1801 domain-containing protein [Candidatus Nanopelagicales bacterium]
MAEKPVDVDAYLAGLAEPARTAVARIRAVVHEAVPGLGEDIRYSMPTFTRDGRSVLHVAGWTNHVSVYPEPSGDAALAADLAPYAAGKGTLKFPLDRPIPDELIARVARALDG